MKEDEKLLNMDKIPYYPTKDIMSLNVKPGGIKYKPYQLVSLSMT